MFKQNFTYFVVRLQFTVTQMGCARFASHHFQMGVTAMGFAEDLGQYYIRISPHIKFLLLIFKRKSEKTARNNDKVGK